MALLSRIVSARYKKIPLGLNLVRLKATISDGNGDERLLITDKFSDIREQYASPRYPIVLCHGFSGFDSLKLIPKPKLSSSTSDDVKQALHDSLIKLDYWYGISESLEKLGTTVLTARVPAFGTISQRAQQLNAYISQQAKMIRDQSKKQVYNYKEENHKNDQESFKSSNDPIKVNLISHSMGGLDCRYLISKLKQNNFQIVSLTTISTPHHGSECADFVVDLVKEKSLEVLHLDSIKELTTTNMKKFNAEVLDDSRVAYFSYGARFQPHWFNVFNIPWKIIHRRCIKNSKTKTAGVGDNDGMVSVESAKWGEYLGTLDQVDHLDLINWTNKSRTVIDRVLFNVKPKFNAVALYLDIADNLAKKGF